MNPASLESCMPPKNSSGARAVLREIIYSLSVSLYQATKERGKKMYEVVLNEDNFEAEVLKSKIPVLVDFWATWCGPCKMLAPTIAKIAEEKAGTVKVCKLDVDEEPEIAAKYGISSIPTLKVFKNGEVVRSSVGVQPKAAIEALLD